MRNDKAAKLISLSFVIGMAIGGLLSWFDINTGMLGIIVAIDLAIFANQFILAQRITRVEDLINFMRKSDKNGSD